LFILQQFLRQGALGAP